MPQSTTLARNDLDDEVAFDNIGLDPRLMKAIVRANFSRPTLIQAKCIPLALQGKDILARARTGSGKTIAYVLPILQKILHLKESEPAIAKASIGVQALVVVPTKELCEQVKRVFKDFSLYCARDISCQTISAK